ncbi:unnamed protein product [Blepharisma stoltei]|uniref:GAF domain-containing protein n=1 Tax=Blepharisma stoltei TaxID=1481888 RepID=A0AAU9JRI6_9CILI|nr:unnamed protein product [Blepharisma stoltei]
MKSILNVPRGRLRKDFSLSRIEGSLPSLNSSFSSNKYTEHEAVDHIKFLSKRIQDLESIISSKNQEIHKLEMMNKQLVNSLNKRDEIIASALFENRKLKETIQWCQRIMNQSQKPQEALHSNSTSQSLDPRTELQSIGRKPNRLLPTYKRADTMKPEEENNIRKFMEAFNDDHALFVEKFFNLEVSAQRDVLGYLLRKKDEFGKLVNLSLKLKRLFKAFRKFCNAELLDDLIEFFISETKEILDCDKATVYVVDELNRELWTRSSKGDGAKRIRIPIDRGIAGYCAMTGASVNVIDAYKDARFDNSLDIEDNYKTKSVLALTIRDNVGNIIGIMQAINKNDGIFTPDDDALFELISAHYSIVLQRVIKNETLVLTLARLKVSLEACVGICKAENIVDLNACLQIEAKKIMNTDIAYFYHIEEGNLCKTINGKIEKFPIMMGLAGKCVRDKSIMNINDAYNHPSYNGRVDIETTLPVLCIPMKNENGDVLAVIEMLNSKTVKVQASMSESKLNQADSEIFEYFQKIVCIYLKRFLNI